MEYNYKIGLLSWMLVLVVLKTTIIAESNAYFLPPMFSTEAEQIDDAINTTSALPVITNELSSLVVENTIDTNKIQSNLPTNESGKTNINQSLNLINEGETTTQIVNCVKNIVDNASITNLSTPESTTDIPLVISNDNDRVGRTQHEELSFGLHNSNDYTKPIENSGQVSRGVNSDKTGSIPESSVKSAITNVTKNIPQLYAKNVVPGTQMPDIDFNSDISVPPTKVQSSAVIDSIINSSKNINSSETMINEDLPQTTTKFKKILLKVVDNIQNNASKQHTRKEELSTTMKFEEIPEAIKMEDKGNISNEQTSHNNLLVPQTTIPSNQPQIVKHDDKNKKQGRHMNEFQSSTTESILKLKFYIPPEQPNIVKKLNPFPDRQMRALGGKADKRIDDVQNDIETENNFQNSSTTDLIVESSHIKQLDKIVKDSNKSKSSSESESESSSSQEGEQNESNLSSSSRLSDSIEHLKKSSESKDNSSDSSSEIESDSNQLDSDDISTNIKKKTLDSDQLNLKTDSTTTSDNDLQEITTILIETSTETTLTEVSSSEPLLNLTSVLLSEINPSTGDGNHLVYKKPGVGDNINLEEPTGIINNLENKKSLENATEKITVNFFEPVTSVDNKETREDLVNIFVEEPNTGITTIPTLSTETMTTSLIQNEDNVYAFATHNTSENVVDDVQPSPSTEQIPVEDVTTIQIDSTDHDSGSTRLDIAKVRTETSASVLAKEEKLLEQDTKNETHILPKQDLPDIVVLITTTENVLIEQEDITVKSDISLITASQHTSSANAFEVTTHANTIDVTTHANAVQVTTSANAIEVTTHANTIEVTTHANSIQVNTSVNAIEVTRIANAFEVITYDNTIEVTTHANTIQVNTSADAIEVGTIEVTTSANATEVTTTTTTNANSTEVTTSSPIMESPVSKGSRSIDESLTNRVTSVLPEDRFKETISGMGKALPTRSIEHASASGRTLLIVVLCITIAVLFLGLVTTIFFMSYHRHHGTLDIEMQEQHCGKDQEDEETMHNLLGSHQTDSGED